MSVEQNNDYYMSEEYQAVQEAEQDERDERYAKLDAAERTELGLKCQINKCKRALSDKISHCNYAEYTLLKTWRLLRTNGVSIRDITKMIWDYISTSYSRTKTYDSKIFGVFTEIKDYTNKKGKTHKAHFTNKGKYMGPVSTKGLEPLSYERDFVIDRITFQIDWSKVMSPETTYLNDIFIPIEVEM